MMFTNLSIKRFKDYPKIRELQNIYNLKTFRLKIKLKIHDQISKSIQAKGKYKKMFL